MPAIETIRSSSLQFLDKFNEWDSDNWGKDKHVYKAEVGGLIVAAKYYRTVQTKVNEKNKVELEKVDTEIKSYNEYWDYSLLQQSPLGIYVPEIYGLIVNGFNEVEGLAVEWIDGKTVGNAHPKVTVSDDDWNELYTRIEAALKLGIFIDPDMVHDANLILTKHRRQKIWFGECELKLPTNKSQYLEKIIDNITENRRWFPPIPATYPTKSTAA